MAPIGRNGTELLLVVINDENGQRVPKDVLPFSLDRTVAEANLERRQGGNGSISKAGIRYLRQMLVIGTMVVSRYARAERDEPSLPLPAAETTIHKQVDSRYKARCLR